MAAEAEEGYDVKKISQRRQPGRPCRGVGGILGRVRAPQLKRDLLLRAAEEHTSVSEIIRWAVRQNLHAS